MSVELQAQRRGVPLRPLIGRGWEEFLCGASTRMVRQPWNLGSWAFASVELRGLEALTFSLRRFRLVDDTLNATSASGALCAL
jgi:hypothetical protein